MIDAVRCRQNAGPHPALGIVQQFAHGGGHLGGAVFGRELLQAGLGDGVGGELGVQVADKQVGHPSVQAHQLFQAATVPILMPIPFGGRQAQTFRNHVRRAHVQARRAAAEVEVMGDAGRERDDRAIDEHRREDEDILQVLTALIGVVVDEKVAGL